MKDSHAEMIDSIVDMLYEKLMSNTDKEISKLELYIVDRIASLIRLKHDILSKQHDDYVGCIEFGADGDSHVYHDYDDANT